MCYPYATGLTERTVEREPGRRSFLISAGPGGCNVLRTASLDSRHTHELLHDRRDGTRGAGYAYRRRVRVPYPTANGTRAHKKRARARQRSSRRTRVAASEWRRTRRATSTTTRTYIGSYTCPGFENRTSLPSARRRESQTATIVHRDHVTHGNTAETGRRPRDVDRESRMTASQHTYSTSAGVSRFHWRTGRPTLLDLASQDLSRCTRFDVSMRSLPFHDMSRVPLSSPSSSSSSASVVPGRHRCFPPRAAAAASEASTLAPSARPLWPPWLPPCSLWPLFRFLLPRPAPSVARTKRACSLASPSQRAALARSGSQLWRW